jgi:hypothetical protein
MSRILALNPPWEGVSTIVNVLKRVGPKEANDAADVRVVQRLIQMAAKGSSAGVKIGVPSVTGTYDAATGFWIFYTQAIQKSSHPHQIIDGIVSPAHGSAYSPNTHWAIVLLNVLAKRQSPAEFSAFLASGGVS